MRGSEEAEARMGWEREGGGQVPPLLVQRAVADSPRWTRAVEGNLGHPLPILGRGIEGRKKEYGTAIPCTRATRGRGLSSPGVRARLGVPVGGSKSCAHGGKPPSHPFNTSERQKRAGTNGNTRPYGHSTAEPSLIVKAHLTETQDSRRMIA